MGGVFILRALRVYQVSVLRLHVLVIAIFWASSKKCNLIFCFCYVRTGTTQKQWRSDLLCFLGVARDLFFFFSLILFS